MAGGIPVARLGTGAVDCYWPLLRSAIMGAKPIVTQEYAVLSKVEPGLAAGRWSSQQPHT